MEYWIVLHKDEDSDFGVTVPDLPGCFSAGSTLEEAVAMAKEAIELHLEGLLDTVQSIPLAAGYEVHRNNPDFADGQWLTVEVESPLD